MSKAANAYLATQVTTTSQGRLLVMLYDAGIKFLKQAKEYMLAKDYAKKGILISRAIDIISELASSLNKEKGGQIAENLQALYTYCNFELARANLRMDAAKLDEIVNILTNLRDAYAQILPTVEGEGSPAGRVAGAQINAAAASTAASISRMSIPKPPPAQEARTADEPAPGQAAAQAASPAPGAEAQEPTQPTEQAEQAPGQQAAQPPKPQAPRPIVNLARHRAANAYSNNM
jgi:flagellar protein FliS